MRRSKRKPPKIPGCKTVVKFLTTEILVSNKMPKTIDEIPNNKAIMREPYRNPWPNATRLPTVAAHNNVNGRT